MGEGKIKADILCGPWTSENEFSFDDFINFPTTQKKTEKRGRLGRKKSYKN